MTKPNRIKLTTAEKKNLLLKWKESGLSLPQWRRENAEELGLPHLSTLYGWVRDAGMSTDAGKPEEEAEEVAESTESKAVEEAEETVETPDETGDSGDYPESDEPTEAGESEKPGGVLVPLRREMVGGDESDVLAKDRIDNLEPSTVPEPPVADEPETEKEPGGGLKTQTLLIIGGAVVLGVVAVVLIGKARKPKTPQPRQTNNNPMEGENPFGYVTIDDF